MDKKSTRGSFLGNASQKMLIHCSCRVCYKEKAQNIEHRNYNLWIFKESVRLDKEKAQNIEHRNTLEKMIIVVFVLDKEKAQNIEHRNSLFLVVFLLNYKLIKKKLKTLSIETPLFDL